MKTSVGSGACAKDGSVAGAEDNLGAGPTDGSGAGAKDDLGAGPKDGSGAGTKDDLGAGPTDDSDAGAKDGSGTTLMGCEINVGSSTDASLNWRLETVSL